MPDPKQKLFKIINQFQDQEAALEVNELLLELERTDPREFYVYRRRLLATVMFGWRLDSENKA